MTLQSMTGFASLSGQIEGIEWAWEVRSVNARGLDLRLRLPDGMEGLEAKARAEAAKFLKRGSVNIGLKISRVESNWSTALNAEVLTGMISAAKAVQQVAKDQGLELAPTSASDLMTLRGVLETEQRAENTNALEKAIAAELPALFEALKVARGNEGTSLEAILAAQIDKVSLLVADARQSDTARSAKIGETLKARVQALLDETKIVDEARLAQELATLAVKADITEEIDRLEAHVASARVLLKEDGPVGRKLDFLMQEFNREANTLCSKSGDAALTAIGLELKVTIDQMREQVQNVE